MDIIISKCVKYLQEVLGINVDIKEVTGLDQLKLPYILIDNYKFYDFHYREMSYILVNPKNKSDITPASYKKQMNILKQLANKEVILLLSGINSFNRKRLIDYKIQFIVPGRQMYLPDLKIDLRERFSSFASPKNSFRPAAQSILLYMLINKDNSPYDVDRLYSLTGYSKATIRRSLLEFENINIGIVSREDKNKILKVDESNKTLWQQVNSYFQNPVNQEIFLAEIPSYLDLQIAGLSALAEYSLIASPPNPVYAIFKNDWYKLAKDNSIKDLIEPVQTESNIKLQIWNYSPGLWTHKNIVDKYSLYLSLKDDHDERVEQALEDILEEELNG